jgi:hypothetical protein
MVRIDPLTEEGAFDTDTFNREDYYTLTDVLKRYLKAEGFNNSPGEYHITLPQNNGPACWLVKVTGPSI